MNYYELIVFEDVDKYLAKLFKKSNVNYKIVKDGLKGIKYNPYNSKVLTGKFQGYRRVRRGNYRIIFRIDESKKEVSVVKIDKRSKIYK
jgi:mRNA-degrading endonuclease RelE of RelBE toxin-antitoxin system